MNSYIMKCTYEEYEVYKNYINETINPRIITTKEHLWVYYIFQRINMKNLNHMD